MLTAHLPTDKAAMGDSGVDLASMIFCWSLVMSSFRQAGSYHSHWVRTTPCWTVQPSGRPQDYDVGWERIDLFQPSRLAFPSVFTTHIHSMRGIGTPHRKADLEVVFVGNADGYHLQLLPMTEVNVVFTEYNIWEAELTRDNTHTYFKWIAEVNRIHSVWCRPL